MSSMLDLIHKELSQVQTSNCRSWH